MTERKEREKGERERRERKAYGGRQVMKGDRKNEAYKLLEVTH